MKTILELKNLSKKYTQRIIFEKINFSIYEGEMIAIMGASGSGKSTLLNILGLLDTYNEGDYMINGLTAPRISSNSAIKLRRNFIAYLFQNYALIENMSVQHNLELALKYTKLVDKHAAIVNALKEVGLDISFLKQKVYALSGGEQQRIALARALLKPFSILFADEPTGSLDEGNKKIIIDLLVKINKMGKTIAIVTHDKKLASACNRIIYIDDLKSCQK